MTCKASLVCQAVMLMLLAAPAGAVLVTSSIVEVYFFSVNPEAPGALTLESCQGDRCDTVERKTACERLPAAAPEDPAWQCILQDRASSRFRLTLTMERKPVSTAFMKAFETSEQVALHWDRQTLEAERLQHRLFFKIAMQEMIENVFHEDAVALIRRYDGHPPRFAESVSSPRTRLVLRACQREDCAAGRSAELECPAFWVSTDRSWAYECKTAPFMRFGQLTLYGKDKVRRSGLFRTRCAGAENSSSCSKAFSLMADRLDVQE